MILRSLAADLPLIHSHSAITECLKSERLQAVKPAVVRSGERMKICLFFNGGRWWS